MYTNLDSYKCSLFKSHHLSASEDREVCNSVVAAIKRNVPLEEAIKKVENQERIRFKKRHFDSIIASSNGTLPGPGKKQRTVLEEIKVGCSMFFHNIV